MSGADILIAAGATVTLVAAITGVWKLVLSPVVRLGARLDEFLDDWFGVPDRAGVPGRKGVMARMAEVEIGKADRQEIADLVFAITEKADRSEVQALRDALDAHIRDIDSMPDGKSA